jgi:hypothetical protein
VSALGKKKPQILPFTTHNGSDQRPRDSPGDTPPAPTNPFADKSGRPMTFSVRTGLYHVSVTALVMVWSAGAAALWLFLARRWPPPALKYVVTAWDTVLITTLVVLAGDPRSPLVVLYFLVIAAAPLRLSVRLVYAATLLTLAAYGFLLAHYAFVQVGYERYYADAYAALRVPRTQEAVTALGLAVAGVLAGQVVRQARRLIGSQAPGSHAGEASRDAEVRRDSMLVAAALVLAALLVALGLLFSMTLGPSSLGSYPAWPVVAVIGVVFVVALVGALAEARRLGTRTAQGEPSTR